jgi:hypothetical protein
MSKSYQRRRRISASPYAQQHRNEDHGANVAAQVGFSDECNSLIASDDIGFSHPLLAALVPEKRNGVSLHGDEFSFHRALEKQMDERLEQLRLLAGRARRLTRHNLARISLPLAIRSEMTMSGVPRVGSR